MTIAKTVARNIKEREDISRQLGEIGSIFYQFNIFENTVKPTHAWTVHGTRTLGSSFILTHGVWGRVGSNAAFVVAGSQPYIGDSREATFTTVGVESPNNTFIDKFESTRFEETGSTTTDGWGAGSLVFGPGSAAQSKEIFLGSEIMTTAKLSVVGSTPTNLTWNIAADGSSFQSATLGSTTTFNNTGSDIRWKATSGATAATTITPLISSSNTQEDTTETTLQDSDTSIAGASLENGVEYLVFYAASIGASGGNDEVEITVEFGSTVIARSISEGSTSGSPESMRADAIHGYYIVTGTGSDALKIRWRTTNTGTAYLGGKCLVAIPLTELSENTDFFQSTQNGDADEVTNVATDFSEALLTDTFNLPSNGDYLVLMSCEVKPNTTTAQGKCRFKVDGSVFKHEFQQEGEASSTPEYKSFSYARIHNLSSGNRTFSIEVSSDASAVTDARRGRIIVIKADTFDQLTSQTTETETLFNSQTFGDFITGSFTPSQTGYVMVIGNAAFTEGSNFRSVLMRMRNDTTGSVFCDQMSADSPQFDEDIHGLIGFLAEEVSTAQNYKFQVACEDPSGATNVSSGDLILWSLALPSSAGSSAVVNSVEVKYTP